MLTYKLVVGETKTDEGCEYIYLISNSVSGRNLFVLSGVGDEVDEFFMDDPAINDMTEAVSRFKNAVQRHVDDGVIISSTVEVSQLDDEKLLTELRQSLLLNFKEDDQEQNLLEKLWNWVITVPLSHPKPNVPTYVIKTVSDQLGSW